MRAELIVMNLRFMLGVKKEKDITTRDRENAVKDSVLLVLYARITFLHLWCIKDIAQPWLLKLG